MKCNTSVTLLFYFPPLTRRSCPGTLYHSGALLRLRTRRHQHLAGIAVHDTIGTVPAVYEFELLRLAPVAFIYLNSRTAFQNARSNL